MIISNVTDFILASGNISNIRLKENLACLLFSSQIYIASLHMRIRSRHSPASIPCAHRVLVLQLWFTLNFYASLLLCCFLSLTIFEHEQHKDNIHYFVASSTTILTVAGTSLDCT